MERSELIRAAQVCSDPYCGSCMECAYYEDPIPKCRVKLIKALGEALADAVGNAEGESE